MGEKRTPAGSKKRTQRGKNQWSAGKELQILQSRAHYKFGAEVDQKAEKKIKYREAAAASMRFRMKGYAQTLAAQHAQNLAAQRREGRMKERLYKHHVKRLKHHAIAI